AASPTASSGSSRWWRVRVAWAAPGLSGRSSCTPSIRTPSIRTWAPGGVRTSTAGTCVASGVTSTRTSVRNGSAGAGLEEGGCARQRASPAPAPPTRSTRTAASSTQRRERRRSVGAPGEEAGGMVGSTAPAALAGKGDVRCGPGRGGGKNASVGAGGPGPRAGSGGRGWTGGVRGSRAGAPGSGELSSGAAAPWAGWETGGGAGGAASGGAPLGGADAGASPGAEALGAGPLDAVGDGVLLRGSAAPLW